jgi:ABC-2 type transport system ATP-binding protein
MIDAENVVYDYPSGRALRGVSFVVRPGAVLALVGPNGAGKSTLMRCIAALDVPTQGAITVQGIDTTHDPRAIHASLGYLPDIYGLYDNLSVRRCLIYAARSRGVSTAAAPAAAEAAAARVGLSDRMESLAGHLSRGLRQRLGIAQTLVHRPRVLLLDEPASGLDPDARASLSGLIRSLAGDGMTLVVSSHILSELEDYCSEMLMLRDGEAVGGGVVRLNGAGPQDAAAQHAAAQDAAAWGVQAPQPAPPPVLVRVAFATPAGELIDRLAALGFSVARIEGADAILALSPDPEAETAALTALVQAGLPVRSFAVVRQTLEEIYRAAAAGQASQPQTFGSQIFGSKA